MRTSGGENGTNQEWEFVKFYFLAEVVVGATKLCIAWCYTHYSAMAQGGKLCHLHMEGRVAMNYENNIIVTLAGNELWLLYERL